MILRLILINLIQYTLKLKNVQSLLECPEEFRPVYPVGRGDPDGADDPDDPDAIDDPDDLVDHNDPFDLDDIDDLNDPNDLDDPDPVFNEDVKPSCLRLKIINVR